MKKSLLLFVLVTLSFAGFCAGDGFKVTGSIQGVDNGKVFILVPKGDVVDTLAQAELSFGAFTMTGEVDKLVTGYLIVEGMRGGMPVFVEPNAEEYVVIISQQQSGVSGGGAAQQLFARFMAVQQEYAPRQQQLVQEYQTAAQGGDMAKAEEIRAQFDVINQEIQSKMDELIKINSDSPVSLFFVTSDMQQGADFDALQRRFNLLGAAAKATPEGSAIAQHLERMKLVSVGQIAPDFTIETPEGGTLSLHATKAKVKLIDFWASWCQPCRGENPHVLAIYNEYKAKGLEIIGVSLDNDKAAWVKAIADDGLTWKQGIDVPKEGEVRAAQTYIVNSIPHTILVDENNRIIAKNLRGEELKAKIAELLD